MNLREFINHRNKCPLCDHVLTYKVSLNSKAKLAIQNKYILITTDNITHKRKYYLSLDNNTFTIKFYRNKKELNYIPLDFIDKILVSNLEDFSLGCSCLSCYQYSKVSTFSTFNKKNGTFGNVNLHLEHFEIMKNKIRYQLENDYNINESIIYSISNNKIKRISLPLIEFTNAKDTLRKLKTLITFS